MTRTMLVRYGPCGLLCLVRGVIAATQIGAKGSDARQRFRRVVRGVLHGHLLGGGGGSEGATVLFRTRERNVLKRTPPEEAKGNAGLLAARVERHASRLELVKPGVAAVNRIGCRHPQQRDGTFSPISYRRRSGGFPKVHGALIDDLVAM